LIYRFEAYLLNSDRQELRRADDRVLVEPQVFDILLYLVRNRERVVTKDELTASVWNSRFVSESTFTSRISAVRHAIGDSGKLQRLIRTVTRKGLRFVGDVWEETDARVANAVIGVQGGEIDVSPQGTSGVATIPDRPSIAVLPFANLSGASDHECLAAGLREDLVTRNRSFVGCL
jgi:DNA-binding winged helix-turn-helix (wHTH) protein